MKWNGSTLMQTPAMQQKMRKTMTSRFRTELVNSDQGVGGVAFPLPVVGT